MKIKVKNLVANPYRNIEAYPIDRSKIEQLRNSIRETSFWDNILARPVPGKGQYQIAYGHHRLVAIKEELGKDTTVDIPVRDLSDEDMLRIMANENMEQWTTDWRVIVETVRETKKFLEKHQKKSKFSPIDEIGAPAIAYFLGANWPQSKVSRALGIMKDDQIRSFLGGRPSSKKIDITTLERISSIQNKEAKKQWIEQTEDISSHEMEEIARFENEPALSDHDKEIVRENILEGRIRGKEQIRETVEFIKVRKLQEAKKTDEEKRREELRDFINKTDAAAVSLSNKLQVLTEQFKEYPDTKKYLPPEETHKLSRSLTMLFIIIKELIDITKGVKKEGRKELTD